MFTPFSLNSGRKALLKITIWPLSSKWKHSLKESVLVMYFRVGLLNQQRHLAICFQNVNIFFIVLSIVFSFINLLQKFLLQLLNVSYGSYIDTEKLS